MQVEGGDVRRRDGGGGGRLPSTMCWTDVAGDEGKV